MTTDPPDNIVQFPGLQSPEQDTGPHCDVIATLTRIIRQMSGLVNTINEGPASDADKAKYVGWLCSAAALCLRAQIDYLDQYIVGGESSGASSIAPTPPAGPSP